MPISSVQDVESIKDLGVKFDYIYLCAHADQIGFGDNKSYEMKWMTFGLLLCTDEILNANCIFLLACCRTGFYRVAYKLFYSCNLIEYVCGPRWTLASPDLSVAFTVFLYNMETRQTQPNQAARRMSRATAYDFECYDRTEVEHEVEYAKCEMEFAREVAEAVDEVPKFAELHAELDLSSSRLLQ
jgi:hypothetical protein